MQDIEYEPYKRLACAVVYQAVQDYVSDKITEYALERFLKKAPMVELLGLNPNQVMRYAIKWKEDNKNGVNRHITYKFHE